VPRFRTGLLTVQFVNVTLQYGIYVLEAGLLGWLLIRRRAGQWLSVFFYLSLLLAVDGIARPYVLYHYGYTSSQYAYFYWLTDVLLVLAAFLLVCMFFRRACVHEPKMWHFIRLLLALVFALTLLVSFFSILRHYDGDLAPLTMEFRQNLYFTCLVLNTLLYILMQQIGSTDDELTLLVCGMGLQFAGPAANFALAHLTPGQDFYGLFYPYVGPLCTLGMLLTWFYALVRVPQPSAVRTGQAPGRELAPAVSREV
jgi:hypothetical protein